MSSENLNETVSDIESIDHQPTPQINTSSSQTILAKEHGRWTENEHKLFLEGIMLYQNEWKNVQNHIGTRSATQARSHAQKFFIKMRKELPKQCSTLNEVKEKICNEFSKKLETKFKPKNKKDFVDTMIKLIFTNEKNISFSNKNDEYNNTYTPPLHHSIQSDNDDDLKVHEQQYDEQQQQPHCNNVNAYKESKIFCISKENSRRNSLNIQNSYTTANTTNTHMNANSKRKLSKKFQTTPNNNAYINIVTVNVINNNPNYNSHVTNLNSNEVKCNSNNNSNMNFSDHYNMKGCSANIINEDLNTGPFALVNFDQLMDMSQNVIPQDDFLNNDFLSLFNFKN